MLAAGGTEPAAASAGGDDEAWDVAALAALDVPILQGAVPDRAAGSSGRPPTTGVSPLDAATQVAIPEFDGRIITRAVLVQGDRRRRAARLRRRPRARRPGGRAPRSRSPGCGTCPPAERRIALVLSAYPTKHARIGNAVGLDTPASAVALLRAHARARATTSGR